MYNTAFYDDIMWPAAFDHVDELLPNFEFVRKKNDKWESPYTFNRDIKRGKAGTFILAPRTWKKFHLSEQNGTSKSVIDVIISEGYAKDFNDAINYICAVCGLQRPTLEENKYYKEISALNQRIADETAQALFSDEASAVLSYMYNRGWTKDELKNELANIGYISEEMRDKYNIIAHQINPDKYAHPDRYEKNKYTYLQRNVGKTHKLIITFISGGSIRGFKFRVTNPESKEDEIQRKYINTKGFSKGKYLEGLTAITLNICNDNDRAIIAVDGELDAIHARLRGISNVISYAGGGILSDEQIKQAQEKKIKQIFVFREIESSEEKQDNTDKKLETGLKKLAAAEITAFVVELPKPADGGKIDVDSFLAEHPAEELRTIIENALPGIIWRANRIIFKKHLPEINPASGGEVAFSDAKYNALYRDIDDLAKEYNNSRWEVQAALINHIERLFPGVKFSDALKESIEQAKKEERQRKQKQNENRIVGEITSAHQKGDSNLIYKLAEDLTNLKQSNKDNTRNILLKTTTQQAFVGKMRQRKIGLDSRYKVYHRGIQETQLIAPPAGALTFICAPTGHGKSTLLQNLALQFAEQPGEGAVLYFSFEEEEAAVITQLLAKYIGYDLFRTTNHNNTSCKYINPTKEDFANHLCAGGYKKAIKEYFCNSSNKYIKSNRRSYFSDAVNRFFCNIIESGKIRVFDSLVGGSNFDVCNISEFIDSVKYLVKNTPVKAVCVDYVQLFHGSVSTKVRTEELKDVCNTLKNLAEELSIPFIFACQFNRYAVSPLEMENTFLAESTDIEKSANYIIQLWNTTFKPQSNAKQKEDNPIWQDGRSIMPIDWLYPRARYYVKVSKAREVQPGAEMILDCNLDSGIIFPNVTPAEIAEIKAGEVCISKQKKLDIIEVEEEPPF